MDFSEAASVTDLVSPFENLEVDAVAQTGADWYRLALTASASGKAIHGLNPTPSCEMLGKVTEDFARKYASGRIRFDSKVKDVPTMGTHITERSYTHKDFKGIRSGTGAFFSFDQGMWEPSKRKRAREAALLAASIASHTNDQAGACSIVAKITSDVIDEEAVEVANIPVSHLRRDVIAVSKQSHKVFSCGTLQRAIIWEDEQILSDKLPEVAAVDWGRVTAIARTIAEGNIQLDPKFAHYAETLGVPYALIKGCHAYVTFGDFVFDPEDFTNIPHVDLAKYNIPSLAMAYEHAAESILKQCYVNLNRLAYAEPAPAAERLMEILDACKRKIKGRTAKKSKWQETDVLAGPSGHGFDAHSAAREVASKATAFNALKEASAVKIASSPNLIRLSRELVSASQLGQSCPLLTDQLTKAVLTQDLWIATRALLAEWLNNYDTADIRVASLKRKTFAFSSQLEQRFSLNAVNLVAARLTMVTLAKNAVLKPVPKLPKINMFTSLRALQGATAMSTAVVNLNSHLDTFRSGWVARYESWAKAFSELKTKEGEEMGINYAMAAKAFATLTPAMAIAIEGRFIDGTAPRSSYIFEAAKIYAKKHTLPPPVLKRQTYANAIDIAEELDETYKPAHKFVKIEAFVYDKVKMFAGDFGVTEADIAKHDENEIQAVFKKAKYEVVNTGGVRISMAASEYAKYKDLGDLFFKPFIPPGEVTYQSVLGSYDSMKSADAHAHANGYATFLDAFQALGASARFDPEADFTRVALAAITTEEEARDDGMILG